MGADHFSGLTGVKYQRRCAKTRVARWRRREPAARTFHIWLNDSSQARLPSGLNRMERGATRQRAQFGLRDALDGYAG